jgi:2-keto-3-deoxy-L-rhamnonate aldolase RhmA
MLKLKHSCFLALLVAMPLFAQAQNKAPNVIVDMQGVDPAQYNADLQACMGTGTQVQAQDPEREAVVGTAARGAAVGAAAGAISGNSGSQGAKTGAGVGVVAAGARNAKGRREARKQAKNEQDMVVKNCMRGRGYNVLN